MTRDEVNHLEHSNESLCTARISSILIDQNTSQVEKARVLMLIVNVDHLNITKGGFSIKTINYYQSQQPSQTTDIQEETEQYNLQAMFYRLCCLEELHAHSSRTQVQRTTKNVNDNHSDITKELCHFNKTLSFFEKSYKSLFSQCKSFTDV